MVMHPSLMKLAMKDSSTLYEHLHIPRSLQEAWNSDRCDVCGTHANQLKGEAVAMVQSLEEAQAQSDGANIGRLSSLVGSRDLTSLQRYLYAHHHAHGVSPAAAAQHHRTARQQVKAAPHTTAAAAHVAAAAAARKQGLPQGLPQSLQAQQYLEESLGASWWTHPKLSSVLSSAHQVSAFCQACRKIVLWFIPCHVPPPLIYTRHFDQSASPRVFSHRAEPMPPSPESPAQEAGEVE
ncbi:uncharacterized protein [Diadema antillarum]|uniref:uncharacterized protein n=1 Tax=Diadema antillarum TaxID=105358 RepID=UPI003A855E86